MQLTELEQAKDSPIKSVMDKLSSARAEANSLKEQLAATKHDADVYQKENQRLQKVLYISSSAARMQSACAAQYKQIKTESGGTCLMHLGFTWRVSHNLACCWPL